MPRKTTPSTFKRATVKTRTPKAAPKRTKRTREWPQGMPLWQTPLPPDVPGAWFDEAAVAKVLAAMRALRHTKGEWAGTAFEPDAWQIEHIIRPVFGWKHPDGTRIIRTVWVEIPRKNGKSTLASGLALVLLCADGEPGAEVYSAAADRNQARIVFGAAKEMARANATLASRLRLMKDVIEAPKASSVYRVLSKLAEAAHGLNVHGALVDEIHVHRNRDLIDAIETGTGARRQPLVLFITTADQGEQTSIYAEKHEYTIQLAKGLASDPTFYGVIWAAEEQDDPFSEATWRKANPGLGVSVKLDYIRKEAERAKSTPTYMPTFLRLTLNRRVRNEARYINILDWDRSAGIVKPAELAGLPCYAGLDLASSTDTTALVLVFPRDDGTYDLLPHFWVPSENILEKVRRDRAPYDVWVTQGHITATPGNVIDYAYIRQRIQELGQVYDIREIGYDRWGAVKLSQELEGDGFHVVPIGQGFASMSAPAKELQVLVKQKRIRHGGNPVLRWMVDNAVALTDPAENIKPDKARSTTKIDGVVATIMALDRATRNEAAASIYESQGLITA